MDFAEQLRVLQAAQGNPAMLTLATVDLAFPKLPEVERIVLKETLAAAAVPHWCDASILTNLLIISPEESKTRLNSLRKLTVVEPLPRQNEDASVVSFHESGRLALRNYLATDRPEWFHTLSQRTASHFASDLTPAGRI